MMRSSVDFPQPDGPISEMNSPDSIVRSIPWSATVFPCANSLRHPFELDDLLGAIRHA